MWRVITMAGKEVTLADLLAALSVQGEAMTSMRKDMVESLDAQRREVAESMASVREEVAGSAERVFKELRAHLEAECDRVKKEVKEEVLEEVFVKAEVVTKAEVKAEVEGAVSELRKYVDETVGARQDFVAPQESMPLTLHGQRFGQEGRSDCSDDEGRFRTPAPASLSPAAPAFQPRGPPANMLSPLPSPPGSVKSCHSCTSPTTRRLRDGTKRRPQEFDGSASWEAYKTQFEFLASARQWSREEMALQLVCSLKGAALEVLNQLPAAQRSSYSKVTAALERRYGHQHQSEVFRTRFRARTRGPGETLTRLAQDLEVLVRRAYPEAGEELITILLRDQFVDAIDNQQLRIYVQQAHPRDLQEALARGLELESFLRTTREKSSGNQPPHKVKARKGSVGKSPSRSSPPPGEFKGNCFSCGQQGHSRKYCPGNKSGGKAGGTGAGSTQYKPCCYNCGKGHRTSECTLIPATDSKEAAGNRDGLAEGGKRQSEEKKPQTA